MEREIDPFADDERRRREQEAMAGILGAPDTGVKPPSDLPPVTAPTSNTMPVTPEAAAPVAPAGPKGDAYTGFNAKHDYSAFDTAREQNPAKSAKDAFAMLSNQAPPPPFQDKAALGAWFEQYIRPGMDQLGHKVSSVEGDKFSYGNHEGNFSVDYGQNAGAQEGSMLQRLQWGADPADAQTAAMYAPGGSGAPAYKPAGGVNTGVNGGAPSAPLMPAPMGGDDPLARVQAEIEALMKGGSTPMEEDALRKLLESR